MILYYHGDIDIISNVGIIIGSSKALDYQIGRVFVPNLNPPIIYVTGVLFTAIPSI